MLVTCNYLSKIQNAWSFGRRVALPCWGGLMSVQGPRSPLFWVRSCHCHCGLGGWKQFRAETAGRSGRPCSPGEAAGRDPGHPCPGGAVTDTWAIVTVVLGLTSPWEVGLDTGGPGPPNNCGVTLSSCPALSGPQFSPCTVQTEAQPGRPSRTRHLGHSEPVTVSR